MGAPRHRARIPVASFLMVLALLEGALVFASDGRLRPFEDVTELVGLTGLRNNAAAWGDFDHDGWVDLYVNGQLWRNLKGRKFELLTESTPEGNGGLWADFDNDGFLDLFCWGNRRLFRNCAGRGFEEVTDRLEDLPGGVSRGAVWGDFDGNRYADLYLGGYEVWESQTTFPDLWMENRAGRHFRRRWEQQSPLLRARGVAAADFDADGDLDVYVSNYRLQPNLLWVNPGNGEFREEAGARNLRLSGDELYGHTIGSAWGDFDSDGYFDLLVGNFSHQAPLQDPPLLFRNLGPEQSYRFANRTEGAGLRWQESYASPAVADFDNDGFLDFFLTTVYEGDRSALYRNNGDWTFTDVTGETGVGTRLTYQAAWADYDNDGDLDLVSGGRLFRNPGQGNAWLEVDLDCGSRCNRSALGSRVVLRLEGRTLIRQVEGGTGEGNQNELRLHFGLGHREAGFEMEIHWPDGTLQKIKAEPNQLILVRRLP